MQMCFFSGLSRRFFLKTKQKKKNKSLCQGTQLFLHPRGKMFRECPSDPLAHWERHMHARTPDRAPAASAHILESHLVVQFRNHYPPLLGLFKCVGWVEVREGNDHIMEGRRDETQEAHPILISRGTKKAFQVVTAIAVKVYLIMLAV